MAIDPSIALHVGQNVPQFDPIGAAQKGLALRKLATEVKYQPQVIQSELDARAAELAQIKQDTEEKERQIAGSRRMAEIVKNNTTVDKNTGKITKDSRRIAELAAIEGLPTEVVFKYTGDAVRSEVDQFKSDSDKEAYLRNQAFIAANLMRNAKTPDEAIRIAQGFRAGDAKAVGDRANEFYDSLFGRFDASMDPRAAARSISTSLSISELAERGLIPGGVSTSQLDPNSKVNARDRMLLKSVGIDVPEGTTREQLNNLPPFRKFIEGAIPSEGTLTEGLSEAGEAQAARVPYTAALSVQDEVKQLARTRGGSLATDVWNKLVGQDPRYAQVQAAIDDYNKRNGTDISISKDGVDAVFARLNSQDVKLRKLQESGAAKATSVNLRQVGETKVTPEQQRGRDTERVRILKEEWQKAKPGSEDRAAIARELQRMGAAPDASLQAVKGSPKGTILRGPAGVYVKINDGPDNIKANWKKQ